ncbi:MAG: circularly permuted type 2 ATP-grasp protein [Gammaproteobacteria bacterium]|nr:circularly permuted type 2 ATP-grasp protein [Gammaproteobacteria bacterium]
MTEAQVKKEPGALLPAGYLDERSEYDELWSTTADGAKHSVRGHWQSLLSAFQQLGGRDLEARRQEARRLFRENGVSYSAMAEGGRAARPWELDPVPFLIPADDWSRIEGGLAQRARLLDAILKDLYGPRHLIRGGMVPAELIFRHSGFMLPADGTLAHEHSALTLYAADVVRGPGGAFRVVADRTQAPAGAGLALETRIACSRILPNLIRATHVHRLARFFRTLRNDLAGRAPHQKIDPRMVVLGQGAEDPAYFDHAYLASYLGFPLVEGADLTVREGHLWLRTIEGLKLVDMILRRVPDPLCDPLELDPSSQVGIPALLEVARRGNVGIVSPLGAGILENPGLLPFLPRIARQFLGEDLKLESIPTWWCGQAESRSYVLENLDRLVVKSIEHNRQAAVWCGGLSAEELQQWRAKIERDPGLYVGQEPGSNATTPALVKGELRPRAAVTRCFVSATEDHFQVMPGGFTRTTLPGEISGGLSASLQGTCKDTWVLASDEEKHLISWPAAAAPSFAVAFESLPSRAAESLYWVGRHAERAEFLTRLARSALRKFNESRDYGDPADSGCLSILLYALKVLSTGRGSTPALVSGSEFVENTLLETVRDATLEGSLAATFKSLERSAVSVRDRWSTDTWRAIDDISETLEEQRRLPRAGLVALENTLDRLVSALVGLTGLTIESTTHEHGWQFLMIGRRLERARNLILLMQSTVMREAEEGVEHQLLEALLIANESVMTHRRRYRAALDISSAVQVLLLDTSNPRSLAYQVLELAKHLDALPREGGVRRGLAADQRALLQASTLVRLADAPDLLAANPSAPHQRERLTAFLAGVDSELSVATAALDQAYFTHVQPTQQLVAVSRDLNDDRPGMD